MQHKMVLKFKGEHLILTTEDFLLNGYLRLTIVNHTRNSIAQYSITNAGLHWEQSQGQFYNNEIFVIPEELLSIIKLWASNPLGMGLLDFLDKTLE